MDSFIVYSFLVFFSLFTVPRENEALFYQSKSTYHECLVNFLNNAIVSFCRRYTLNRMMRCKYNAQYSTVHSINNDNNNLSQNLFKVGPISDRSTKDVNVLVNTSYAGQLALGLSLTTVAGIVM